MINIQYSMKRLLSIENFNQAPSTGQFIDTTQSDSSQTGDYEAPVITQTSKRARKVRTRARASATAINSANAMNTQPIDSLSQFNSPVRQSQSQFVAPGGSGLGNTQQAMHLPISDFAAVMQQLNSQQECIYQLQGKVDTALNWLQRIAMFLGIEEQQPNRSGPGPDDPPSQPAASAPSVSVAAPVSTISLDNVNGSVVQGEQHLGLSQVPGVIGPVQGVQSHKSGNAGSNLRGVILDAIYRDSADREKRAKSIVISGIKSDGDDSAAVQRLFRVEFDFDPGHFKCMRLGRPHPDHIQPLLVSLQSRDDAGWLVANANFLRRSKDTWTRKRVFINQNLSYSQRQAAYERRCRRRAVASAASGPHSVVFRSPHAPASGESLSRQPDGETVDDQRPIMVISNTRRQGLARHEHIVTNRPCYSLNDVSDFPGITSDVQSTFVRVNHSLSQSAVVPSAVQSPAAVGCTISTAATTSTSSSTSGNISSSLTTSSVRNQVPSAEPTGRTFEQSRHTRSSGGVLDQAGADVGPLASALTTLSGGTTDGVSVSSDIGGNARLASDGRH